MLISFNWLKEYIHIKRPPADIAEILTMAGLEVDSVGEEDGDTIFDIDLTPNRGDCLSVIGVARELGSLTGHKLKYPKFSLPPEDGRPLVKIAIEDKTLCGRYAGRVIKGVKVGESPDRIKKRLQMSGIRPINNIVDVTNYVLLEYGQPLHAFDYEKLNAGHIRVAKPSEVLNFMTLDGTERRIDPDTLMIWDGETPIAVAGVMGGLDSQVDERTTDIFLESACFDSSSVRRTATRLGIKTESSFRFERRIDILNVDRALDRAAYMISELAGGRLFKKVDLFPRKYTPRHIKLKYETVNTLLGTRLSNSKIQDLLLGIGAQVEDFDTYLYVEVPSFRNDIEKDVDLVEETARLYGYRKIGSVSPCVRVEALRDGAERKRVASVKRLLAVKGYSEVINYSFMNPEMLRTLGLAEDDYRSKAVAILNPLRKEESLMRSFLVPSLLENLIYNFNRGAGTVKLFELSKVFYVKSGAEKLPGESLRLGGLCFDEKRRRMWKSDIDDFYVVKGDIEAVLDSLSIHEALWMRSSEPFLHPGRSADLILRNKKAGFMGVLSPTIMSSLDIKSHKADIILFEFDMDVLMSYARMKKVFRKYSIYPYIQRDISVLVDSDRSAQDILRALESYKTDLIEEIRVFDYYRGKNIPENKVSLGFCITYRSFDRTLSEEEIERVHKGIVDHLVEKTGVELRT